MFPMIEVTTNDQSPNFQLKQSKIGVIRCQKLPVNDTHKCSPMVCPAQTDRQTDHTILTSAAIVGIPDALAMLRYRKK